MGMGDRGYVLSCWVVGAGVSSGQMHVHQGADEWGGQLHVLQGVWVRL